MAEEETIGDVLTRVSALKKDEMITEVEAYGLEVKSDWTKDEIMDHFEEFLNRESPDTASTAEVAAAPEAAPQVPEVVPRTDEPLVVPATAGDEPPIVPESYEEIPSPGVPGEVRIQASPSASRGWGQTGGAYAP